MEIFYKAEEKFFPYVLLAPALNIFEFSGTATTHFHELMYTGVKSWLLDRYKFIHPDANVVFKIEQYNQGNLTQLIQILEIIRKANRNKVSWYHYPNAWEEGGIPEAFQKFSPDFLNIKTPDLASTEEKINGLIKTNDPANTQLAMQLLLGQNIPIESHVYRIMINNDFKMGKNICFEQGLFKILEHISGPNNIAVGYANITQVPTTIGEVWNLKKLDLRANPITKLPDELGQLRHLEVLDLSFTNVATLPTTLSQLTKLKDLYLQGTLIDTLQVFTQQFPNLQAISLSSKQAEQLTPENFGQLDHIQRIYVSRKDFELMPRCLQDIQKLSFLSPLHQGKDDNMPTILMDACSGIFEVSGRSLSDATSVLAELIFDWLDQYALYPNEQTIFVCRVDYFGSHSFTTLLLQIFRRLESIPGTKVHWYFEADDEDMQETGIDYAEMVNIPFELIAY